MTRLLILGAAPLPFEPLERQYAANLRTWHFTQPLLEAGHEVRLVACRLPNTYPDDTPAELQTDRYGFEYVSVSGEIFCDPDYLHGHCADLSPEAIVGVNTHPAAVAARIETDVPIWCDLNGWVMAEAQAKCRVYDDDRYLSHFWKMERDVLDRADVISTVSEAQAAATVGELATRGRLGRETFGYEFVYAIPNAVSDVRPEPLRPVVRGPLVDDGAFVVLWIGGYNTWTDVDLLYEALALAMSAIEELHFVSTGGIIEGHDEITFTTFRERIAASPFGDRCHFVGWVPTEDIPGYLHESDLGLSVDSRNYETVFGARNRLNEMIKMELPILTTLGTEISQLVAEENLGLVAPLGDSRAFGEQIIWSARHPEKLREMARAAKIYAGENLTYAATTASLQTWAKDPWRAPDDGRAVEFRKIDFFTPDAYRDSAEAAESSDAGDYRKEAVELRHQLDLIHTSKMWRFWMLYLGIRRRLMGWLGRDS